jgi:hypothetical protein
MMGSGVLRAVIEFRVEDPGYRFAHPGYALL